MRLIDADALTFTHDYVTADGEPCITKAVIDNAPTIDQVRHGRWESFEDVFMDTCYECSECGLAFYLADGGTPKENEYHYCPNCGAKMDEVKDDDGQR